MRGAARKKPVKTRAAKTSRVLKKPRAAKAKPKVSRIPKRKPVKKAAAKTRPAAGLKRKRSAERRKESPQSKGKGRMTTGTRKRITGFAPTPAPETPPRLLAESKTTTAALGLLEKGIKLIYQKEFKKARHELGSIASSYPGETEIIARAQSYLQICKREEAAQSKPQVTRDELYTLGVMEHNRGNYDGAISYFKQSLEKNPKADHILYSLAASRAMKNDVAEAIRVLGEAIELNEHNRIYAKNDPDFTDLHAESAFADLVGTGPG